MGPARLEVISRKTMTYRGSAFTELDVDAMIASRPQVVLIDELAQTNIPGSRNAKRWQDIEEILDAGHHGDLEREHPAPGSP
jgi:two-component system sensor histidine kinase KdpD